MSVQIIKSKNVAMSDRGSLCGVAKVGRAIDSQQSQTMGAGLAFFDNSHVEWTLLYDEVIFVHQGVFRITTPTENHEAFPGDIVWIPKSTSVIYGGNNAYIFYAVYPGNWKEIEHSS